MSYLPVVAPILKWRYSSTVAYKDLVVSNGIFVWPMISIINLHWEKWMVNNIDSRHPMVFNINTIFMPRIEWSGAYCYCPVCLLSTLKLYCRYEYTKPCMINCIWGLKTTMTSGESTCLISFATAPLTCSERGGSEKFKMKMHVSSGIRTHTTPVHDRKVTAP